MRLNYVCKLFIGSFKRFNANMSDRRPRRGHRRNEMQLRAMLMDCGGRRWRHAADKIEIPTQMISIAVGMTSLTRQDGRLPEVMKDHEG